MAKKGPAVQLQAELTTDDEWEKFLEREGLLVIDIYSEWCGPCSAMQAVLKKIKLEIGGDLLQLATAKSDDIQQLERFRTKSEPTWMFVSNGKIVNLMYGANSPKLQRLIIAELKKEESFRQGQIEREGVEVTERFGVEVERYEEEQGKINAIIQREEAKRVKEEFERKRKETQNILETMNTVGVILVMAHAKGQYQEVLNDLMNEAGLTIKERERVTMNESMLEQIYYFCSKPPFNEAVLQALQENDVMILMIKPGKDVDIGKIDKPLLQLVYGDMEQPPGSAGSPSQLLYKDIKPAPPAPPPPPKEEFILDEPILEVLEDVEEEEDIEEEEEEEEEEVEALDAIEKQEIEEIEELPPPEPEKPVFIERGEEDVMGLWVPPNDKVRATCIKQKLTREALEELQFFMTDKWPEKTIADLTSGNAWALLMKRSADLPGLIDDVVLQMVYGNMRAPPGAEKSPCQKLMVPKQNEDDETLVGIWAPPDPYTKGLALKILFPQLTAPLLPPEEVIVPPHIIVAYDAYKARDVIRLSEQYPGQVLAYGFFTSEKPGEAELIAKTVNEFETKTTPPTFEEKIVVQLSKTNEDCMMEFTELNPCYKSLDAVEGEEEAKFFFPLGYTIPPKIKEEIKKKVKRKGKRSNQVVENANEEAHVENAEEGDKTHEEDTLIGEEGDVEEHESGEEEDEDKVEGDEDGGEETSEYVDGADKATSPMPELKSEE